jgi:cytochrome P450
MHETSCPIELGQFNHHESSVEAMWELYPQLHSSCPVAHSDALGGFYMLTGYDDVKDAASRWNDFSSAGGMMLPKAPFRIAAIEFDPPEHDFWRGLFREVLRPGTYRAFAERLEQHIHTLIGEFAASGRADLVAELTDPLPVMSICELIGIHEPDRAREVRRIALEAFYATGDPAASAEALGSFAAFCLKEVEDRRSQPRDDFLTRLGTGTADGTESGRPLEDAEIVNLLIGFLIAGHHTTSSVMSSMLLHVAADPLLRVRLIDDPALIPKMVEETVRLDTPLHGFFRQTTRDVEIDQVPIPVGSEVMLNYAAANRDPAVFDRPQSLDIDRPKNPHLGFGFGIHTCVGAQLARLELQTTLRIVLTELTDLALRDEPINTLWSGGNLYMIDRLPVTFTPHH